MLYLRGAFWSSETFLSAAETKSKLQASARVITPALLSDKYMNTVPLSSDDVGFFFDFSDV